VALSRRPTDQPATRYLYVNGSPGAAAGAFCRRRQQITYERTGDATQWPPVVIGRAASADQPDYQPTDRPTDRRLSFNTGDDGGGAGPGPAPPSCAPLRPSTYIKRHRNAAAAADTATALAPAAASSHNRTPRALAAATAPAIEKCDI